MSIGIDFQEMKAEATEELTNFYLSISEFGRKNILTNQEHLAWKHIDNPAGKSIFVRIFEGEQIIGVMFFQKNYRELSRKKDLYFLVTDFAISERYRSLKMVLEVWDQGIKYINKRFPNTPIVHSSNVKSEPIYNRFFKELKETTITPTIFCPKKIKGNSVKPIEELNIFNDEIYNEWRWGEKSKRKYIKLVNKKDNQIILVATIKKLFGLRILIILDFDGNYFVANKPAIIFKLLILCIRHISFLPLFYINKEKDKSYSDYRQNFKNIPKILTYYSFPIYVHNNEKFTGTDYSIKLSVLDVL